MRTVICDLLLRVQLEVWESSLGFCDSFAKWPPWIFRLSAIFLNHDVTKVGVAQFLSMRVLSCSCFGTTPKVPGPGLESGPQRQQCRILNPLHWAWDRTLASTETHAAAVRFLTPSPQGAFCGWIKASLPVEKKGF